MRTTSGRVDDEAPVEPFAGIRRAGRRDQARRKARAGMQVSGTSVKVLARVAAERAGKASVAARERTLRDRIRRAGR